MIDLSTLHIQELLNNFESKDKLTLFEHLILF